jgi:hypothetical protein
MQLCTTARELECTRILQYSNAHTEFHTNISADSQMDMNRKYHNSNKKYGLLLSRTMPSITTDNPDWTVYFVAFQLWPCSLTGGWVPAVQGNSPLHKANIPQPVQRLRRSDSQGIATFWLPEQAWYFSLSPCPDKLWHPPSLLSIRGTLSRRQSCQDVNPTTNLHLVQWSRQCVWSYTSTSPPDFKAWCRDNCPPLPPNFRPCILQHQCLPTRAHSTVPQKDITWMVTFWSVAAKAIVNIQRYNIQRLGPWNSTQNGKYWGLKWLFRGRQTLHVSRKTWGEWQRI